MRSFNSYLAEKDLVEGLVALNVDVDQFCEQVIRLARKNNLNEESLNEIFGVGRLVQRGIQGLAQGVGGALGIASKPIKDAGRGIAAGAAAAGRGVADAGRGIANTAIRGASAAKDYVQSQAGKVGQYVGDAYQQGKQKEAMRQATDRISGLQQALIGMGMDKSQVDQTIAQLSQMVQQAAQSGGAPAA